MASGELKVICRACNGDIPRRQRPNGNPEPIRGWMNRMYCSRECQMNHGVYNPTPEEIAAAAAEIQAEWTDIERQRHEIIHNPAAHGAHGPGGRPASDYALYGDGDE